MFLPLLLNSHSTGMTMDERFTQIENLAAAESIKLKRENAIVEGWAKRGGVRFARIALAVLDDSHITSWKGRKLLEFKRMIKQKYGNGKGIQQLMQTLERSTRNQTQFSNNKLMQRMQVAKRSRPYRGRGVSVLRNFVEQREAQEKLRQMAQRGRPAVRGRGGLRRGGLMRPNRPIQASVSLAALPSREQLDKELDEYMSSSRAALDRQLDEYMAEAAVNIDIIN